MIYFFIVYMGYPLSYCPDSVTLSRVTVNLCHIYIDLFISCQIRCDGCQMFPINGPRFKCRNCDDFDFCETCFKTRKHNTRHTFGRINEPGKFCSLSLINLKCI